MKNHIIILSLLSCLMMNCQSKNNRSHQKDTITTETDILQAQKSALENQEVELKSEPSVNDVLSIKYDSNSKKYKSDTISIRNFVL